LASLSGCFHWLGGPRPGEPPAFCSVDLSRFARLIELPLKPTAASAIAIASAAGASDRVAALQLVPHGHRRSCVSSVGRWGAEVEIPVRVRARRATQRGQ